MTDSVGTVITPASGNTNLGPNNQVSIEGQKPTYSAAVSAYAPYATAQDVMTIVAGTLPVRIMRAEVSGRATAANQIDVQLLKRTTANVSVSPTAIAACRHNTSDGAPTATVVTLTAAPTTTGTIQGISRAAQMNVSAAGSGGPATPQDWDFSVRNTKGIVLMPGELFAINLAGAAVPAGTALDLSIEWCEG